MKNIVYFILLIMISIPAQSQNSDIGNWWIYFGNKQINEKWNLHHEVQYRNFNFIGDTEQLLLRAGLGYNLSEKNNNLLLGYGFIYSEPYIGNSDDKTNFNEHRIYQQFITRQNFNKLSLQHRYRFEQRFIEEDFKLRLRYFLGLNYSLSQKETMDNTFYLSMYNEVFLNTEGNYFDRNRLYGSLGYRFSKSIKSEIGFMNQTLQNSSRNQLNIITFINF
ncbi:DUF2490 domain-containing protein [Planktosalinus lacus]|uniref:DUF2490 domain-containing protein n=1 Tax=Planktosalinus lacus TaxID=1526573 RepID=A0A8J2Y864_9FLAO|nr:DUF2490 domain-containing protein [Planktosalinus lacus]GGD81252.1 hypothetical protein GCM10011312_01990 [Planktosalinus lacus]